MVKRVGGLLAIVLLVAALAGCSGGGAKAKGTNANSTPACPLVARLDTIANNIKSVSIADPVASKRALSTAVDQYVATVHQLRAVAPTELRADLERVEADVQQYRFADARVDRASLDSYAARVCHRTVSTVTSTLAPTTTLAPSGASTTTTIG